MTTSSSILESVPLHPYVPLSLAGTGTSDVHRMLHRSNQAARARGLSHLAAVLPHVPAWDDRRAELPTSVGSAGPGLDVDRLTESVLRLVDRVPADDRRFVVHRSDDHGDMVRQPIDDYVRGRTGHCTDRVHAMGLHDLLQHGAVLQIRGLDRDLPVLNELALAAERTVGAAVAIDGFVGIGSGGGIGSHVDRYESWIIQLHGSRTWRLNEPSIPWFDETRRAPGNRPGAELLQHDMQPGDVLVVPRGIFHDVTGAGSLSIALRVNIKAPSPADLLTNYLQSIGHDSRWLRPIHHPAEASDIATTTLPADGEIEWALHQELARTRATIPTRPRRRGGLLAALADDDLSTQRFVSAIGGGVHVIDDRSAEVVTIAAGGRALRIRSEAIEPLARALSGCCFAIGDLGLEESAAEALVRELLDAELITLADRSS